MKSRMVIVLLATLALIACNAATMSPNEAVLKHSIERMRYGKDPRTGLCFGVVSTMAGATDFGSISITNVPCDKVEKYLQ